MERIKRLKVFDQDDIKEAQPDLYAKLNADSFLQKIKDVTPK
jgi:hypothetical protein